MRILAILIFTLLISSYVNAQVQSVSLGYFGPYGVEPGVSFSAKYSIKNNMRSKDSTNRFVSIDPSIAFYSRRNNHANGVFNIDVIYNFKNSNRKWEFAPKAGLGFLLNSEVQTLTVDFSGKIINKDRVPYSYIMMNVGGEITRRLNKQFAIYFKPSISYLQSKEAPNTGLIFLDIGLQYSIDQQ